MAWRARAWTRTTGTAGGDAARGRELVDQLGHVAAPIRLRRSLWCSERSFGFFFAFFQNLYCRYFFQNALQVQAG